MAERGFDAITLAEIAQVAGVGRTAVYNHFPDKESMLLGFITHETEQYAATLQRALDDIDDPVEQLSTYVRQQAQLKRVYHVAPGPELRSVLSRGAQQRVGSPKLSFGREISGSGMPSSRSAARARCFDSLSLTDHGTDSAVVRTDGAMYGKPRRTPVLSASLAHTEFVACTPPCRERAVT